MAFCSFIVTSALLQALVPAAVITQPSAYKDAAVLNHRRTLAHGKREEVIRAYRTSKLSDLRWVLRNPRFHVHYNVFPPPLLIDPSSPCRHVTAIVATHNEQTFLEESLSSAAYTLGQVIVVDHGSTDLSATIIRRVQKHFSNVHSM